MGGMDDTERLNFVEENSLELVPRKPFPDKPLLWNVLQADGPHSQVGIAHGNTIRQAIDNAKSELGCDS